MPSNPLTPHMSLYVQMFLTDCQARGLRPRTLQYYRQQLTWFLTHIADENCQTIEDVTPYMVRAYFVYLQTERKLASASIHTAARALRAFFNFLAADCIIEESPMKRVKMPKNEQPDKLPFSVEELRRLMAAVGSQRDRAIVYCLLDSGCRISEFASWKYGDIDFKSGAIHLAAGKTKGRRSRVVYLGVKAKKELLKLLTTFDSLDAATPLWQADKTGSQLSVEGLREILKRIGRKAKVAPAGAHRYRRTFAVNYLRNGGDVMSLQNLLGHRDLEMVRRYVHLVDGDLQAAHAKFSPVDRLSPRRAAKTRGI